MFELFLVAGGLIYLRLLREKIIFDIRQRALFMCHDLNQGPSHSEMVNDLTKWTFEDFYPELTDNSLR